MEKIKILFAHKFFKIIKWVFLILIAFYFVVVIVRVFQMFAEDRTNAQVEKIHNTKLQLSDVMGDNLPPDPGALADETIAGIDANDNGIRDDVELAVFKEYPNSAKTRAALLQYALALQMEVIQPMVNTQTVTEIIREEDRASSCMADILVPRQSPESTRSSVDMENIKKYISFIDNLQINNKERDQAQVNFYKYLRSYNSLDTVCDIDYSRLPN
jgi:hypothetical protein